MATTCVETPHQPPTPRGWFARRLALSGSERGQSLVLVTLSMTVLLVMCAFAIDLATWYQRHHQAQVAADAAALAAANCLANGKSKTNTSTTNINCTSATDTTDAQQVGGQIATTNLPNSSDSVNVDTISHTVTVTSSSAPQVDFAGLVSLHPRVSARSVASYSPPSANYSVFVGNDTCTVQNGIGGLQIESNGGGTANVTGLYSDGTIQNNDDSNKANWTGGISDGQTTGGYQITATPFCGSSGDGADDGAGSGGTSNYWQNKNTTVDPGQEIAYPVQYNLPVIDSTTITGTEPGSQPTVTPGVCTFASTYFSTDGKGIHAINYPGIYCVTDSTGSVISTSYSGSCNTTADDTAGSIDVRSTLQGSSGYEFVGPCVIGDGALGASIPTINLQTPLIYGTAQHDTSGPCLDPSTTFVNGNEVAYSDTVYLANNNLVLNGAIYAPCGTVELYKNNDYSAFIEAANVTFDQNNFQSWTGTGPPSALGGDGLAG